MNGPVFSLKCEEAYVHHISLFLIAHSFVCLLSVSHAYKFCSAIIDHFPYLFLPEMICSLHHISEKTVRGLICCSLKMKAKKSFLSLSHFSACSTHHFLQHDVDGDQDVLCPDKQIHRLINNNHSPGHDQTQHCIT